jgi:hypothetical protein
MLEIHLNAHSHDGFDDQTLAALKRDLVTADARVLTEHQMPAARLAMLVTSIRDRRWASLPVHLLVGESLDGRHRSLPSCKDKDHRQGSCGVGVSAAPLGMAIVSQTFSAVREPGRK